MTSEEALAILMEDAEVALIEAAAKYCRRPEDYVLWRVVGRDVVMAASRMTADQRAIFVIALTEAIAETAANARTSDTDQPQTALRFNK
jgi:1,2-phenylacetyl-CoA epoxidase PaaB subunit